ncbi:MAG: heavy-metal-associated domain-containing protein, partial [Allosphingosinicella sp.]
VIIEPELPPVEEEILDEAPLPTQAGPSVPIQSGPSAASAFNIQVSTPDAAAVQGAEIAASRVNGVTSAITTSLALGGTSIMRVTYVGDSASLAAALQAQGWQVEVTGGNSLRISR